jgi:hypothetical protein
VLVFWLAFAFVLLRRPWQLEAWLTPAKAVH